MAADERLPTRMTVDEATQTGNSICSSQEVSLFSVVAKNVSCSQREADAAAHNQVLAPPTEATFFMCVYVCVCFFVCVCLCVFVCVCACLLPNMLKVQFKQKALCILRFVNS